MKAIVGYTGFVGSNLTASGDFDAKYNSGNIREAFGTKPDLLVYSGLRAEKYLANNSINGFKVYILENKEKYFDRLKSVASDYVKSEADLSAYALIKSISL